MTLQERVNEFFERHRVLSLMHPSIKELLVLRLNDILKDVRDEALAEMRERAATLADNLSDHGCISKDIGTGIRSLRM